MECEADDCQPLDALANYKILLRDTVLLRSRQKQLPFCRNGSSGDGCFSDVHFAAAELLTIDHLCVQSFSYGHAFVQLDECDCFRLFAFVFLNAVSVVRMLWHRRLNCNVLLSVLFSVVVCRIFCDNKNWYSSRIHRQAS